VRLELTDEQGRELQDLLVSTLGDMSHEIAATDDAAFRARLVHRRQLMADVAALLQSATTTVVELDGPSELVRELAHPGD